MTSMRINGRRYIYTKGSRVELSRTPSNAVPVGTRGVVLAVRENGRILVRWDNGTIGFVDMDSAVKKIM